MLSPLDESSATSIQLYNELYAYYIIDESIVTDVFSFMTSQAWHLCVYIIDESSVTYIFSTTTIQA